MAISTIERNKPPYRVVYEYFRKRTESAGDGMLIPPRSKLAEQFNVAEGTITRAIELLKKNGFAYGQQGRGTYICERKRKSSKLQQIGFCTYSIGLDIARYSRGLERVFGHKDYNFSIHTSQLDMDKYKNIVEHITDNGFGGVILLTPPSSNGARDSIDIGVLAEADIPVVLMGSPWPSLHCDRVEHTRRDSARLMAERAVAGGCRNPGVLLQADGDEGDNTEFIDELNYAFESRNIKLKKEDIFYFESSHVLDGSRDFGIDAYHFTKKELSRISGCDALLFQDDGGVIGALRALRENGIKVPEQIKLLSGYRGATPDAIRINPTTVDTNIEEQARMAGELLKRRIQGYDGPVEAHYVSGRLVEGSTA